MARFIVIEGENVWGLVQEAVIRLDERKEGHEPEEQLPSLSGDNYISKADTKLFKRAHKMNSFDGPSMTFPQRPALII